MRILIVGGPEESCGGALRPAEERLRAAGAETERFWPLRTEGLLCSGCGACRGAGLCVADPRGGDFLRAAAGCDGFVLAAPVGLFGLGVDFRNLLRRASELAAYGGKNPFAGKPAAPLTVGRQSRRAAAELRELAEALGLELCELTELLPARMEEEEKT